MRQWAISIGINHYESFQPLNYAQHDAQAVRDFLVNDVGIAAAQCVLLTDTSPQHLGRSTYPSRENIQGWLDLLMQQYLEPGDALWFFFSGYGVCQQGQDYLVSIEGSPSAVPTTAIPLAAIFQSLQRIAIKPLVLLDINRNEGSISYETVGTQTGQLAYQAGIPTILSCKPEQFSRETSALGHGFFTAALLEGLQNRQYSTLATLDQFLSARLPELSEHYWRPIQQPVTVSPAENLNQPILPLTAAVSQNGDRSPSTATPTDTLIHTNGSAGIAAVNPVISSSQPLISYSGQNGNRWQQSVAVAAATESSTAHGFNGSTANGHAGANGHGKPTHDHGGTIAQSSVTVTNAHNSPSAYRVESGSSATNGFINGSSTVLPAQANGFNLRQPIDSPPQNHENGVAHPQPSSAVTSPHSDPPEDPNEIPDALFWRPVLLWGGLAVVGLILGVLLRNCSSFTPKPQSTSQSPVATANHPVSTGATLPNTTNPASTAPTASPSTAAPLASAPAQSIGTNQHFGIAGSNQLNVPTVGKLTTVNAGSSQSSQKSLLAAARARASASVNSDQASPYSDAIQEAKKVQPGQPDYAQAQKDIARWSDQIMRIARRRGRQGSFDAAIVAAKLVPQDQSAYKEAANKLQRWCPALSRQRGANPVQRRQAQETCQKRLG